MFSVEGKGSRVCTLKLFLVHFLQCTVVHPEAVKHKARISVVVIALSHLKHHVHQITKADVSVVWLVTSVACKAFIFLRNDLYCRWDIIFYSLTAMLSSSTVPCDYIGRGHVSLVVGRVLVKLLFWVRQKLQCWSVVWYSLLRSSVQRSLRSVSSDRFIESSAICSHRTSNGTLSSMTVTVTPGFLVGIPPKRAGNVTTLQFDP